MHNDPSDVRKGQYRLVQLKSGVWSVHSSEHAETFHPVIGPMAEANALYVLGLELPGRIQASTRPFIIWDVGLGAAANAIAVLKAARDLNRALHLYSFDQTLEPLRFALEHAKELEYPVGLERQLGQLCKNSVVSFRHGSLECDWKVICTDFPGWLRSSKASELPAPDAILYDAFSPAKNPDMWTLPLFQRLHALAANSSGCALATYTRSTFIRVEFLLAGFYVGVGEATGEKDQTTVAATVRSLIKNPLGMDWLERARRSRSAEPLHEAIYRQLPLSETTWHQLRAHPQFQ